MDKIFKNIAYISIAYQTNLSKTSKHWGSFLSHCISYLNNQNNYGFGFQKSLASQKLPQAKHRASGQS